MDHIWIWTIWYHLEYDIIWNSFLANNLPSWNAICGRFPTFDNLMTPNSLNDVFSDVFQMLFWNITFSLKNMAMLNGNLMRGLKLTIMYRTKYQSIQFQWLDIGFPVEVHGPSSERPDQQNATVNGVRAHSMESSQWNHSMESSPLFQGCKMDSKSNYVICEIEIHLSKSNFENCKSQFVFFSQSILQPFFILCL